MPVYQGLGSSGHTAYLVFLISLAAYLFFSPMRITYSYMTTLVTMAGLGLCYANGTYFFKKVRALAITLALAHIVAQVTLMAIYFPGEFEAPRDSKFIRSFIIITSFTGFGCFLLMQRAARNIESRRAVMVFRLLLSNIAVIVAMVAIYIFLKRFLAQFI